MNRNPDRRFLFLALATITAALSLSACSNAPSIPDLSTATTEGISFADPTRTSTSPAVFRSSPTPPADPHSLDEYLELWGLTQWEGMDGHAARHPIGTDVFRDVELYAPFWAAFEEAIIPVAERAALLEANGLPVVVEVRWNGVSSGVVPVEVELFLRDAVDPESVIWTGGEDGLIRHDVHDIGRILGSLPVVLPLEFAEPGHFEFLDDPFDEFSEGMHVLDANGEVIAFWDGQSEKLSVWQSSDKGWDELVNGFDLPFIGFNEEELILLWEAFFWIHEGFPAADEQFSSVDAIRRSDLDRYQAGAATQAFVLLSPRSFRMFQEEMNASRGVDVIAVAGYLVHEVTHVNQSAVCTEPYAQSQGMTLEEYALFLETGPGQAYDTEVTFLYHVLDLRDGNGFLLQDSDVRDMIEQYAAFRAQVVGQSSFPNGEMVPTCAQNLSGTAP